VLVLVLVLGVCIDVGVGAAIAVAVRVRVGASLFDASTCLSNTNYRKWAAIKELIVKNHIKEISFYQNLKDGWST
jgi:hypothetical protein